MLQLKVFQGLGCPDKDIKSDLRQGVLIPTSVYHFGHQLKNFKYSTAFFLQNLSLTVINMQILERYMLENILAYKVDKLRDKDFCTKLGYAFDNRTYQWLERSAHYQHKEN